MENLDRRRWRALRAGADRANNLRLAWYASAWLMYLDGARPTPPAFAEWDTWFPRDTPLAERILTELRAAGERFSALVAELKHRFQE